MSTLNSDNSQASTNAAKNPFDESALATWLEDVAGTSGPVTLKRIGAGQSNLTFTATDPHGTTVVVRRPPLGTLAASAHDVEREGRIMAALASTNVPTPTIFGATTNNGVPVIAMSAIPGITIGSKKAALSVTPEVRRAVSSGLVDAMSAIHAVDLESVGLDDLASHDPYAPRQLRRWAGQWAKTKTRELPALDELTSTLENQLPEQSETVLVHGDLHIGNVIADEQTGVINAVVDWELTTLGDPLADIGSLLAYWPVKGGLILPGFEAPLEEGFPSPQELAERYLEQTGRSEKALAYWHTLGLWKVAIIAEGVVRRVMNNPENAAKAGAPTQEMVEGIVAYARHVANSYGIL